MKTLEAILIIVVSFVAIPLSISAAEDAQTHLTIHFADGEKIEIADWIFEYEFGASDEPPMSYYFPSFHRTKDLMFAIETTERGVTYADEKSIPASQLRSMKFEYKNDHHSLKKVRIVLSNNSIVEIDDLKPPKTLLTKAKHFFKPTLTLKGKATVNKKKGEFSKRLYYLYEDNPKERIVEIQFGN